MCVSMCFLDRMQEHYKLHLRRASLALEAVALEIANHGWKHNLRISLDYFFFVHSPS